MAGRLAECHRRNHDRAIRADNDLPVRLRQLRLLHLRFSYRLVRFGKLLAEQIENIDRGQVEAVRATGASPAGVLLFGVLPQVLPRFVGLTIYQWDIHLRQSTIIGIVGAGGIGSTLLNAFSRYDYDFALAILLVVVALVLLGEAVSAVARARTR